jgi:Co/Zn/Cd efflux system component
MINLVGAICFQEKTLISGAFIHVLGDALGSVGLISGVWLSG